MLSLLLLLEEMFSHRSFLLSHSCRVALMSQRFSQKLFLEKPEQEIIFAAGLFHDVGKLDVPIDLLNARRPLSESEWKILRAHSATGQTRACRAGLPESAGIYVRGHHERVDGSGYPDGLSGDSVLLGMRIIGLCDAVDAMTNTRPYRESSFSAAECKKELWACREQFDAKLLEIIFDDWDGVFVDWPLSEIASLTPHHFTSKDARSFVVDNH